MISKVEGNNVIQNYTRCRRILYTDSKHNNIIASAGLVLLNSGLLKVMEQEQVFSHGPGAISFSSYSCIITLTLWLLALGNLKNPSWIFYGQLIHTYILGIIHLYDG